MKRIFWVLVLIFMAGTVRAEEEKKEFKNPIFSKTLYGMATKGDTVKITPSSYYIKNYYGYETSAKCELLENEMDKVVLKCLHLPAHPSKKELVIVRPDGVPTSWIYKFVIPPKEEQVYGKDVRVILYPRLAWEEEDQSVSYENYVIYTSEEN